MSVTRATLFLSLVLTLACAGAWGDTCALRALEAASPEAATGTLGSSVAGAGGLVVTGAPYSNASGFESGAAFVFRVVDHELVLGEALTAPGVGSGDRFGFAVATDGFLIAVGSPDDSGLASGSGSVRVFREAGGNWSSVGVVLAPDGGTEDRFGASVAIDGNTLVIGAPSRGEDDAGAVYVFAWDGASWTHTQTIVAGDSDSGDRFGTSVSIDGNRLLIGAFADDEGGEDAGAGYIYDRVAGVWVLGAKLISASGAAADLIGWSSALSGDIAVLGAPGRDAGGSQAGGAVVFDYQGGVWVEQGTLVGSGTSAFDRRGSSVAVEDGLVILGAPRDDADGANSGSASVFARSSGVWHEVAFVRPSPGNAGAELGAGVALADGLGVFGAPKAAGGDGRLFVLPAIDDCDASGALDACEVASGALADENGDLVPDACAPPPCPGDATGNGVVDVRDLNLVLAFWGQQPYEPFQSADITGDGFVDVDDLNVVLTSWGCRR
ncbi:MAG: hypothetical protein KDA30_01215 [Phycisphaerales bacterium]|nr:hypothetical protein [Phycisphaerales bacterium]